MSEEEATGLPDQDHGSRQSRLPGLSLVSLDEASSLLWLPFLDRRRRKVQEIEPELAGIVLKVRPDLDPVLSCQVS